MGKRITKKGLTAQQELFCKLYASDKEFFGSGVESYAEAYDLNLNKKGEYNSAKSNAGRLLTNDNILKRIDELLDIYCNDQIVDRETAFVIIQKKDLPSKVAAIKEYNRVRSRVTTKIKLIDDLEEDDEQIEREVHRRTGTDIDRKADKKSK